MIGQSIAKRYAKGLFAVGEKNGQYKHYLEEMDAILKFLDKEKRIGKALILPILEIQQRKEILSDIMKAFGVSLPLANMFSMLMEKNRMNYLSIIKEAYGELVDDKEGRVKGTLWSAYPFDDSLKIRIEEVLKKRLNKDVVLNVVEDKTLIGGVKVMVKGTIIDGSVKKQLEILKENILKE